MKNFTIKTGISLIACIAILTYSNATFASCDYAQAIKVEDFAMGNMLTWSTSTEINNKAFLIQKSTDGIAYTTVGKVKGAGTSQGQSYRFLDVAANKGTIYYRLEQIDLDGTKNISKATQMSKTTTNNFVVVSMTPPEQGGLVEITVSASSPADLTYLVEKGNGQMVYTGTQKLNTGRNIVSLDMSEMELGTYKISLKGANESETLTFKTTEKQSMKPFADFTDGK